jgi:hypothetical protein
VHVPRFVCVWGPMKPSTRSGFPFFPLLKPRTSYPPFLKGAYRGMAAWSRPGFLRQRKPGVPSDVMVCLRVLARSGRVGCMRSRTSFPSSSGATAMSIFCAARLQSTRGIIEWLCTQECWIPEVATILGAAARYRRAAIGSSRNDAHPDNSALQAGAVRPHTGSGSPPHRLCRELFAVRPHTGFVESLFFILPRTGHGRSKVLEMLPTFSCIS